MLEEVIEQLVAMRQLKDEDDVDAFLVLIEQIAQRGSLGCIKGLCRVFDDKTVQLDPILKLIDIILNIIKRDDIEAGLELLLDGLTTRGNLALDWHIKITEKLFSNPEMVLYYKRTVVKLDNDSQNTIIEVLYESLKRKKFAYKSTVEQILLQVWGIEGQCLKNSILGCMKLVDGFIWERDYVLEFFGKTRTVNLSVAGEFVTKGQMYAYEELEKNKRTILKEMENQLFEYYTTSLDEIREYVDEDEWDECAPELTDKEQLGELIELQDIELFDESNEEVFAFALIFAVPWEEEHCLVVKFENYKIEIGDEDLIL